MRRLDVCVPRFHTTRLAFLLSLALAAGVAGPADAGVGGDDAGTCVNACGGYGAGNNGNGCYCDSVCTTYGDCCADYQPVCNGNTGCTPNSGGRYILHIGGMCSQGWNTTLANKAGYTSIDVKAVQTNHSGLSDGSHTVGVYFDQCCTGSNLCYVLNYSGGDNVVGHRFANSGTNWNINWVGTSGGAGGGSELSGNFLADIFARRATPTTTTTPTARPSTTSAATTAGGIRRGCSRARTTAQWPTTRPGRSRAPYPRAACASHPSTPTTCPPGPAPATTSTTTR
jgi:hypothetical protein